MWRVGGSAWPDSPGWWNYNFQGNVTGAQSNTADNQAGSGAALYGTTDSASSMPPWIGVTYIIRAT
jgi:hypothetical protein